MLTQLCKILEYGLSGDTDKLRAYAELLVKNHFKGKPSFDSPIEQKIAWKFHHILEGIKEEGAGEATLDEGLFEI